MFYIKNNYVHIYQINKMKFGNKSVKLAQLKNLVINDDHINLLNMIKDNEMAIDLDLMKLILKYDSENILKEIFKTKPDFYLLNPFFTKLNVKTTQDKYIKLFFALILYRDFTSDEYSKMIDKFVKYQLYSLTDYIHILGYKTDNIKLLLNNYPENKYNDLIKFGYDIDEEIENKKIVDQQITTIEQLSKYLQHSNSIKNLENNKISICTTFTGKMIEYLENNNIMKFNKSDLTCLCENKNTSGILYILSKENVILTKNQQSALFGDICDKKNKKKRKIIAPWKKRSMIINNIYSSKYPINYDTEMPQIINNLVNKNVEIYIRKTCWDKLLKNNCFNTIQKLTNLGKKPKMNKKLVMISVRSYVISNEPENIKKLIECKIVNPQKLIKESELVDIALIYNFNKSYNYLKNELNMKHSNKIISQYITNRRYSGINYKMSKYHMNNKLNTKISFEKLIEQLEKIDYQIKTSNLNEAVESNAINIIKYFLEIKKFKPTRKLIENSILSNKIKTTELLTKHFGDINGKNMIDRILSKMKRSHSRYRYRYRSNYEVNVNTMKYLIKTYNATASQKSMDIATTMMDHKIMNYLNKKFHLKCTETIMNNSINNFKNNMMCYRGYYRGGEKRVYNFYKNIEKNSEKLNVKITDEHTIHIIKSILNEYRPDKNILKNLIEKINYKFTEEDLLLILQRRNFDSFTLYLNQINNITPEFVNTVINFGSTGLLQILIDNKQINLNDYITLKKLNEYIRDDVGFNMIKYLLENTDVKITPHTLHVLIQQFYKPTYIMLKLFLKKSEKKINNQTKLIIEQFMENHLKRNKKDLKKDMESIQIVNYIPTNDEIIHRQYINQYKNIDFDNDDIDDMNDINYMNDMNNVNDVNNANNVNNVNDKPDVLIMPNIKHDEYLTDGIINQIENEMELKGEFIDDENYSGSDYYSEVENDDIDDDIDDDDHHKNIIKK